MRSINRSLILIVLVICGLLALWYTLNPIFKAKPDLKNATLITSQNALTDFNLVDTNNQPFTQHNLRGHWTVLFFGYTDCPDICPNTLNTMHDAWNQFTDVKPAKFIFASINPNTDSPTTLKNFLARFHPDFVGVTGKDTAVKQLGDQLGVFATRSEEVTETNLANVAPTSEEDTDVANKPADHSVIIDHTAALMLINPHGKLHAIITPPLDPQTLAQDLVALTKSNPNILKR